MKPLVRWIDRTFYPDVHGNWDDEIFRKHVLARLSPASAVLDLGAGAGIIPQMNFKGRVGQVTGLDPDPRVLENPFLDDAKIGMGDAMPFPDESFDIVIADNVLEHLDQPAVVFSEIARVLRPGGVFLAKTPNRAHYMPRIARLTPHALHQAFNRSRGRASEDTFVTCYRANSCRDLESLGRLSKLALVSIDYVEGRPEYLRFSPLTYVIGLAYERLVNAAALFAGWRVVLIITMQKSAIPTPSGVA